MTTELLTRANHLVPSGDVFIAGPVGHHAAHVDALGLAQGFLLPSIERSRSHRASAPVAQSGDSRPQNQHTERGDPEDRRMPVEARLQQDEFAISSDQKIDHGGMWHTHGSVNIDQAVNNAREACKNQGTIRARILNGDD